MQTRDGCDPGGVSDGSRLAIYPIISSECPSSRRVARSSSYVRHAVVFFMDFLPVFTSYLSFLVLFASVLLSFPLLLFVVYALVSVFIMMLFSLELCRINSNVALMFSYLIQQTT